MSTYIAGITDYIPQIQDFHPDLNLYSNVLQSKQSQYDTAHKQLNSIYGTALNSPMIRDSNIERRDKFFKMIDQDVKKISGLDLSKEENVDAAMQVFKPLYDDQYIAKDMTFTKQLQGEMNRAENFRTCVDPDKCGGQYWEGGVRALKYKAEEFRNSSDAESLNVSAPRYTPHVDVIGKAFKTAKDMGFNITKTDTKGGYIVTHKNGEALSGPLYNYFVSKFQEDPAVQDMYKTQAYLDRKDFAKSNAFQYGDENAAEQAYLREAYSQIEKATQNELKQSQKNSKLLDSKKSIISDKINNSGGVNEDDALVNAYMALQDEQGQNEATVQYHDKTLNILDKNSLAGMDIKGLRQRVDGAVANHKFFLDMKGAADSYSQLNSEEKYEADPFALNAQQHKYAVELKHIDQGFQAEKLRAEQEFSWKMAVAKGQIVSPVNRQADYVASGNQAGTSTSAAAYDELQAYQQKKAELGSKVTGAAGEYLKQVFNYYTEKIKNEPNGALHYKEQFKKIFGEAYDQTKHTEIEKLKSYNNPGDLYSKASATTLEDKKSNIISNQDYVQWEPLRKQIKDNSEVYSTFAELGKENNQSIKNYQENKLTGDDKKSWNLFWKEDGSYVSQPEYEKRLREAISYGAIANHGQDPANLYNKQLELYKNTYREGYKKGTTGGADVPLVKSWQTAPGMAAYAEGLSSRLMSGHIDAADKADPMFKDFSNATDAFLQNGSVLVSPGPVGTSEQVATIAKLPEETKDKMSQIARTFIEDARNVSYKASDPNRPIAKWEHAAVAGNDPNMVAITVYPNEGWAKKYEGNSKNPGITWDKSLYQNGITIYMNKDAVKGNAFFGKLEQGNYKTMLNIKPYTVNQYPEGGQLQVKSTSGGYEVQGHLKTFDNGKQVVKPIRYALPLDADPDQFIPVYEKKLKEVQDVNFNMERMWKSSFPGPVKDVKQVDALSQAQ